MKDEYIRKQDAVDAFNRIKNTLKNPDNFTYSKNVDGYRFSDEDFC